jgi:hypothetical protein
VLQTVSRPGLVGFLYCSFMLTIGLKKFDRLRAPRPTKKNQHMRTARNACCQNETRENKMACFACFANREAGKHTY